MGSAKTAWLQLRLGLLGLVFVSALACQTTTPVKQQEPPAPEQPYTGATRVDPIVVARQNLQRKLLGQAEQAFRQGRLTEPRHDNAYDRFHSVLMMDADNQQARSGLQAIVIRYADMIREALAASRYGYASELLNRAQVYFPGHQLLLDLKRQVAETRRHQEEVLLRVAPSDLTVQEFSLPGSMLSSDRDKLIPLLASIAQRLKVTDESVMIYARTDAEGRWIYRQMKQAVDDYRIRGDIRLTREPKIAILPPL